MPPADPYHDPGAERIALADAIEFLRANTEAVLLAADVVCELRYVISPRTGKLISCVPLEALDALDLILFIPAESDDALQLMVTPRIIEECADTDRFQVFHAGTWSGPVAQDPTKREGAQWVEFTIDSGKHAPWVFDGPALMVASALASHEPSICRALNADKAALARLCDRLICGTKIESPVCVGIDERGLHIRAKWGVVRVRHDKPVESKLSAGDILDVLLG